MGAFAVLDLTSAHVAEVRTFEHVAIGTLRSLLAVSIDPEGSAYRVSRGVLGMNIGAGRVVATALGEVNAEWRSLF